MALTFTKRKDEIYNFIVEYRDEYGFPPSVREIGDKVNIKSTSTVHQHLHSLERLGYIKIFKAVPRGIQVLERPKDK